jgi:hypothetical protein
LKFDSLTVLDYIRTSIEILMQMKLDEEKLAAATSGLEKTKTKKEEAATSSALLDV